MKYIDVNKLNQKLKENPSLVIIDVRSEKEYNMGHVPQTKNISLDIILNVPELAIKEIRELTEGEENIYIICLSDRRSFMACHKLFEYGVPNTCFIQGGTKAWRDAGYPLQKTNP
ncbi:MAG: rhodanese-like domain-containing protein [Candidatus Paracaedibacteraceae bacterium]|nr:rhodanese-like domain-containing protein [Candidatus Paracaedibacteraceae bacterium]